MFKQTFINLCNKKGVAPSAVCMRLGLSNATYSKWTDESVPRRATLQRIADYFGVTVDYLLGKEQEKKPLSKVLSLSDALSPREIAVAVAYRTHPNEQAAVDKLLDVPTTPEEITVYNAAYFGKADSEGFKTIPGTEWAELKNTPETDQDLT